MSTSSFEIRKATLKDIPTIQSLSKSIWNQVYPSIVSQDQINFMLDKMYSTASLTKQMETDHHEFFLGLYSAEPVGFASISIKDPSQSSRYRLHKLYLEPFLHGKGLGKLMVSHLAQLVQSAKANEVELNVNKRNPAVSFYKHLGFTIEKEVVLDIGNGYVMDDFIMVLDLAKNPI
jgi:ribosomal protein S18 acetylase RimI-like enzyme